MRVMARPFLVSSLALILSCSGEKQSSGMEIRRYSLSTGQGIYKIGFLCETTVEDKYCATGASRIVSVSRVNTPDMWDTALVIDKSYCPSDVHACYSGLDQGTKVNAWHLYGTSTGFDEAYKDNLEIAKVKK